MYPLCASGGALNIACMSFLLLTRSSSTSAIRALPAPAINPKIQEMNTIAGLLGFADFSGSNGGSINVNFSPFRSDSTF
mgnify:CR=1 FL=1